MQTLNLEQPNESSCSPLRLIAAAIRACINPLSPPDENAKYLIDLVDEAMAVPGAFPNLGCLRREVARLQYNYRDDWHLRALLAAVTAFAPGFDPSKPFSVGTWYTGGWEGVGPIADAIETEADRMGSKGDDIKSGVRGHLSPSDLAKRHNVPLPALRARLYRWRYDHDTGYVEVNNKRRNTPHFLYDELAVMSVIDSLQRKSATCKRVTDV